MNVFCRRYVLSQVIIPFDNWLYSVFVACFLSFGWMLIQKERISRIVGYFLHVPNGKLICDSGILVLLRQVWNEKGVFFVFPHCSPNILHSKTKLRAFLLHRCAALRRQATAFG